jgi:hypothetical protein
MPANKRGLSLILEMGLEPDYQLSVSVRVSLPVSPLPTPDEDGAIAKL